jgi:hypothetical protein
MDLVLRKASVASLASKVVSMKSCATRATSLSWSGYVEPLLVLARRKHPFFGLIGDL